MAGINFDVELLLSVFFLGLLKVHMIASFSAGLWDVPLWDLSLQSTALEMFFIRRTHRQSDKRPDE